MCYYQRANNENKRSEKLRESEWCDVRKLTEYELFRYVEILPVWKVRQPSIEIVLKL